jgi:RNA polymerase sigma factor (TIGR02999 family)
MAKHDGGLQDPTRLLLASTDGDREALDQLVPQVYEELRRIAHRHLHRERPGHTLNTTALVHEAYLALIHQEAVNVKNRLHFFALASRAMRNILIDYARRHCAKKRGGGRRRTSLEDHDVAVEERAEELVMLDAALDKLAQMDERLGRVVECRFFAGMTAAETAEALEVSVMTVHRDWQRAKLWLYRLLESGEET